MTNAQKLLMIGGAPWLTRRDYPKLVGGLEAWFDETDPSSMIMDSANRVSLIADKSGNSSTNVLCLNGVAGNYASAPDSAALSITGDIDIRVHVALDDWTPAGDTSLVAKRTGAGQFSYQLDVKGTTGLLYFYVTNDGTTPAANISSVAPTVSDFGSLWVRVTRVSASGLTTFYTGTDGVSWAQLGTTVNAGLTTIFDSTAVLEIGSTLVGTANRVTGKIYRAQIYNGIAGTLAFDANFATASKLAPSFTESSSNAATVTINTSGATGARISGARDLYQGTAANQPIYLPWSGTNYGYLNGVSGNYFSTPDSAAVSITTSIDLRVDAASNDWGNGLLQMLISKNLTTGGQWSYDFYLNTAGNPVFRYSPDGSALRTATSSAAVSFANFARGSVRVTYNSATGDVVFYTCTDFATWVQLGTTQTLTSGSIFDGSTALAIGSNAVNSGGIHLFNGLIYRAQIYNGIDGTLAFDFNPAAYTSGTTFLDSSANAATITINGGAMIVTRPGLYSDGSDDYSKTPAFALSQPETVYFVGSQVTWTAFDFLFDGNTTDSMRTRQEGTTPGLIASAGSSSAENDDLAVGSRGIVTNVFNGANSVLRINRLSATTGNFGAANGNGFTLAARGAGDLAWGNITAQEVVVYSGAHDTATQDRVIRYLARKHRLPAV